jgi:hypothetical protein
MLAANEKSYDATDPGLSRNTDADAVTAEPRTGDAAQHAGALDILAPHRVSRPAANQAEATDRHQTSA